jgi:hypothetical protein
MQLLPGAEEGAAMEPAPVLQGYTFQCLACGRVWDDVYEIRRTHDRRGRVLAAYFLGGERAASPLAHGACVSCDSPSVRVTAHPRQRRKNI